MMVYIFSKLSCNYDIILKKTYVTSIPVILTVMYKILMSFETRYKCFDGRGHLKANKSANK